MMASFSLSFQCFATLSASGSSGFGALSSAWMLQQVHAGLESTLLVTQHGETDFLQDIPSKPCAGHAAQRSTWMTASERRWHHTATHWQTLVQNIGMLGNACDGKQTGLAVRRT